MSKESSTNGNGSDWKDTIISIVNHAGDGSPADISLHDALQGIHSGKWKDRVEAIRHQYSEALAKAQKDESKNPHRIAKNEIAEAKKALPAITFSGRFSERRDASHLVSRSGLLCADIDGIPLAQQLALLARLKDDPHVQFAFVSPSGWGLKVVFRIRIGQGTHLQSYYAVERHIQATYGQAIDTACKDVNRLCFVSHDPDVFIREEDAEILEPLEEEEREENSNTAGASSCNQIDKQRDASLRDEVGDPIMVSERGAIRINQTYFVYRFALEHKVVFETLEQAFYLYDGTIGTWEYSDPGNIKKLFREDWIRLAPVFGGLDLLVRGTDVLFNQFVNGLRSHVGAADIFKRLPRGLIHVGNGMLQLHANGEHELLPFSPDYYSRNPILIDYDPNAKCPKFEKLIQEQLDNDDDRSLLIRWMGSTLLQGNSAQRIMFFIGVGKASKTTIVNILVRVVGLHNVAALRTHLLHERFEIGRLHGKTLLTACDVPGNFMQNDGAQSVKKLVGHDYIPGEIKGVMREIQVTGDFNAVVTCNEKLLIRLQGGDYDVTAWARRLLQINFLNAIKQEDRIADYDSVLIAEEGRGILAYIIEGAKVHLAELEKCGDFILSTEQEKRINQLLTESEALRFFVEEAIMRKEGRDLETDDIAQAFMDFCNEREWTVPTTRQTEMRLRDLMLEIHRSAYVNKTRRSEDNGGKPQGNRGYKDVAFKSKTGK